MLLHAVGVLQPVRVYPKLADERALVPADAGAAAGAEARGRREAGRRAQVFGTLERLGVVSWCDRPSTAQLLIADVTSGECGDILELVAQSAADTAMPRRAYFWLPGGSSFDDLPDERRVMLRDTMVEDEAARRAMRGGGAHAGGAHEPLLETMLCQVLSSALGCGDNIEVGSAAFLGT